MVVRLCLSAIVAALLSSSLNACPLDIRVVPTADGYTLQWHAVPGIDRFRVEESGDDFNTLRSSPIGVEPGQAHEVTLNRVTNFDTVISFRVAAVYRAQEREPSDPPSEEVVVCRSATVRLQFLADSNFRSLTRKSVIPIVGATPGQNGARFKTSLRLISSQGGLQSGTLVFHPAGDAMPATRQIRYEFQRVSEAISFDDIMASFGATGLGSIDIIPDENQWAVPLAEVRLFNETGSGTFGTFSRAVQAGAYVDDPDRVSVRINAPPAGQRLNLGFRTLAESTIAFFLEDGDGQPKSQRWLNQIAADQVSLDSAESIFGMPIAPSDVVRMNVTWGAAIPFFTLTDNSTNDPSLIIVSPDSETHIKQRMTQ